MANSVGQPKLLFVVESPFSGYGFMTLEEGKSMGFETHFITQNPKTYGDHLYNPCTIADFTHVVDVMETNTLLSFFQHLETDNFIAMTFDEKLLVQLAKINGQQGNPTAPETSLKNAIEKHRTRAILHKNGLNNLNYALCSIDEIFQFQPVDLNFPVVIKPINKSGSLGVQICDDLKSLKEIFYANNDLEVFDDNSTPLGNPTFLIEEYLKGDEFSAECIWNPLHMAWEVVGFSKKTISDGPYCVELEHTFPFFFESDQDLIETQILQWLNAIGLSFCFVHVEFKREKDKISLVEINPRFGGDHIVELIQNATQINLVKLHLQMLTNTFGHIAKPTKSNTSHIASIRYIIPTKKGRVKDVVMPTEKKFIVQYFVKKLPRTFDVLKSSEDRIGFVMFLFPVEIDHRSYIDGYMSQITFEYE